MNFIAPWEVSGAAAVLQLLLRVGKLKSRRPEADACTAGIWEVALYCCHSAYSSCRVLVSEGGAGGVSRERCEVRSLNRKLTDYYILCCAFKMKMI